MSRYWLVRFALDPVRPFGALAALRFLSILPLGSDAETARPSVVLSSIWLAGGVIGAGIAALFVAVDAVVGGILAAVIAVGFSLALGACLHEDGLADVCDAIALDGGVERRRAVARDSVIGVRGATALIIVVIARIALLYGLNQVIANSWEFVAIVVAAGGLSRSGACIAVLVGKPAEPEFGSGALISGADRVALTGSVVWCLSLASLLLIAMTAQGDSLLWVMVTLVPITLGRLLVPLWNNRFGGITGDTLGATQQLCEVAFLFAVLACF